MSNFALPRVAAVSAFLSLALAAGAVRAEAINGAIYTSTGDHSAVNANQYPSKASVYLNGGPSNFPQCTGGVLDNGIYHFQVTDPAGQQFNPEEHEAVATLPAPDASRDHEVSATFQPGYRFKGMLVRPARVQVFADQGQA